MMMIIMEIMIMAMAMIITIKMNYEPSLLHLKSQYRDYRSPTMGRRDKFNIEYEIKF